MNDSVQNMRVRTVLVICIFFFSACTGLTHRISEESKEFRSSTEANAIISTLKSQNHSLETIKGLGRISFLENQEKGMTARIAWVASTPDKIRITLSSVAGQPVISAASDGQWVYFYSHAKGDFYKKRPTNSNMKRFFTISFKSEDIVTVLLGRVPVVKYFSAILMEDRSLEHRSGKSLESSEASFPKEEIKRKTDGRVLLLKNKWGAIREKIYLNDVLDAHKIEMFNSAGRLLYRIELIKMQTIQSHRVPYRLKVSDDNGAGFRLELDRYWADATVSPSVFTLTPP